MVRLKLSYGSAVGVGSPSLREEDLENAVSSLFTEALDRLMTLREREEVGFLALPRQDLSEVKEAVEAVEAFHPRWLLVVGIGGSSLGLEASLQALYPWIGEGAPKVRILDNVDPEKTASVLREVDTSEVVVNVVSKSGGTAESMANFLVVFDALCRARVLRSGRAPCLERFPHIRDPGALQRDMPIEREK
jgi:glucose-6-phosphate isomerase